jgi:hypothetical protein
MKQAEGAEKMSHGSEFIDANGDKLVVGSRVSVGDCLGTVRTITDADADVDEGRMVYMPSRVIVDFDAGDSDSFTTTWTAKGPWDSDAPHQCDDLEVIA